MGHGMFVDSPYLDAVLRGVILGPVALLWVTAAVRLVGLRALSKITAFDFISTVATGSMLGNAATASEWLPFFQSLLAILGILGLQVGLASLRRKSRFAKNLLENEPVLLMHSGTFLRESMKKARVTEGDIWAKLRSANIHRREEVSAVVLETTGDISVIHGGSPQPVLMESVSGEIENKFSENDP